MIVIQGQSIVLPSGENVVGPAAVPDALNAALVTLKYNTLATPALWADPATILKAIAFLSVDGGPFQQRSTFSTNGGPHLSRGAEVPETTWGFSLLSGINRQIRLTYEVVNGPLISTLDLVVV